MLDGPPVLPEEACEHLGLQLLVNQFMDGVLLVAIDAVGAHHDGLDAEEAEVRKPTALLRCRIDLLQAVQDVDEPLHFLLYLLPDLDFSLVLFE